MMQMLESYLKEIEEHLEFELIPFWESRAIDEEFGGYFTNFDKNGILQEHKIKYLVTQTRMLWGFSKLYRTYGNVKHREMAEHGFSFLLRYFWDQEYGGWFWQTTRAGEIADDGKLVYGQTFAIYALSEYSLATGNTLALEYAEKTFDLLQKHCADLQRGGYYENMERDFTKASAGYCGGDLKSLDIHMHILEAFTTLYECSQKAEHARKLEEVITIILTYMVDIETGCGLNQFSLSFEPRPAILIRRTWNDEREVSETIDIPADTTSYGHNAELVWLLNRAANVLGKAGIYKQLTTKIFTHLLQYGYDEMAGGVFRDGLKSGKVLVQDKEWWQNCEALVGFLDAYEQLEQECFLDCFMQTWRFAAQKFINHEVGEWRQLLQKDGTPIIENMGNPWKGIYHTGRAMLECRERLQRLITNTRKE